MIAYYPKHKGFILFGTKHLFEFGIHIGHIFKKSKFYARWFLQGVSNFFFFFKSNLKKVIINNFNSELKTLSLHKRKKNRTQNLKKLLFPIFLISFAKSLLSIRSLILMAQYTGYTFGRGWFICHNQLFIPFTLRYALLLGMGYSVYDWIAGCLTNFKKIFNLFFILYREYNNGLILEKKHYMFIYRLLGFNITGFWVPSFLFLPRMLESRVANWEGGCLFIKSVGIIDSNVLSGDTTLPLTANDDSFLSVNFFFFILSYHIFKYLFFFLKRWRDNVRELSKRKYFWILTYFTFYFRSINYKYWRNLFYKFYALIYKKPYFFRDSNQIYTKLTPFGVFRFGLDCKLNEIQSIDFNLKSLI